MLCILSIGFTNFLQLVHIHVRCLKSYDCWATANPSKGSGNASDPPSLECLVIRHIKFERMLI